MAGSSSKWAQGSAEIMETDATKNCFETINCQTKPYSALFIVFSFFSSLFISFHLVSSLFISFHLFSSLFISFHLVSSLFISFHLFSSRFISFHLVSFFNIFCFRPGADITCWAPNRTPDPKLINVNMVQVIGGFPKFVFYVFIYWLIY